MGVLQNQLEKYRDKKEKLEIMTDFEGKVYSEVMKIKKGEVATYKDIAIRIGNPKSARAVGNALHKNPDNKKVPCHRVVNSKGECSGSYAFGGKGAQEKLLKSEGIKFKDGKIIIKAPLLSLLSRCLVW